MGWEAFKSVCGTEGGKKLVGGRVGGRQYKQPRQTSSSSERETQQRQAWEGEWAADAADGEAALLGLSDVHVCGQSSASQLYQGFAST